MLKLGGMTQRVIDSIIPLVAKGMAEMQYLFVCFANEHTKLINSE